MNKENNPIEFFKTVILNSPAVCDKVCEELTKMGECKNCKYQVTPFECIEKWTKYKEILQL